MTSEQPIGAPPAGPVADVLAANQAFYDAHEAADLLAMDHVWEHSERVVCVHPGWTILRTWPTVRGSWERILNGPGRNQFILTNIAVSIDGRTAMVTLEENLIASGPGGAGTGTIAATNVFVQRPTPDGDRWLLIAHHGSPVMQR